MANNPQTVWIWAFLEAKKLKGKITDGEWGKGKQDEKKVTMGE